MFKHVSTRFFGEVPQTRVHGEYPCRWGLPDTFPSSSLYIFKNKRTLIFSPIPLSFYVISLPSPSLPPLLDFWVYLPLGPERGRRPAGARNCMIRADHSALRADQGRRRRKKKLELVEIVIMEGSLQRDEPKSASSEENESETVNEDAGVGRSYECMFCKRGFSTAQALGGHMNIHRRDRARIRHQPVMTPSASAPERQEEVLSSHFHGHLPFGASVSEGLRSTTTTSISTTTSGYHMYHLMPPAGSGHRETLLREDPFQVRNPQPLSLFGEDLQLGPSSPVRAARLWHREEVIRRQDGEDGELDLELRLGHEP
ncbi:hypothetical protein H6P81_017298 [Aristolochia fimbriata]|uniref:C2H2-type domain-containing protein n=1 Tax=Aristolochia fimbriata TaxID=158543 RepID=A0AAV7DZJ2_ARIFI|nr:hypothetical protein H6P81_017298 [Aristolochia fimbriata]